MPGFRRIAVSAALAALFNTGCQHAGAGRGELQSPPSPTTGAENNQGDVAFKWRSKRDPARGKIEATLEDGRHFAGDYLQLTQTTTQTTIPPYGERWMGPTWGPPSYFWWGSSSTSAFVTRYSGEMFAHLRDPNGQKMRCRFLLKQPDRGVGEGATGDCQLSTGETVFGATLSKHKSKPH